MKVLFVHQNFPAQFRYLATAIAQRQLADVVAIGAAGAAGSRPALPGVQLVTYEYPLAAPPTAHPLAQTFDDAVRRGYAVAYACRKLRAAGFVPVY